MAKGNSLTRIRSSEVEIGKPLPWSVYDSAGNLLLTRGFILESKNQLDGLIQNGFLRDATKAATARTVMGVTDTEKENKDIVVSMDQVNWLVGEALDLQPHDNPEIRYNVRLIGFVKNKTILVTAPIFDGKFAFVREGQTFVARSFFGKRAYAFTVSVVKSVHTPHPYLHLSYPQQVLCTIVRKGSRAQVKIIAAVSLGQPAPIGAVTLSDISVGGASGIAKEPLGKQGDEGTIKFKVNTAEQSVFLSIKIVLRSVSPSKNGDGFKHGFEFLGMTAHERLVLSAFVNQILAGAN